MTLYAACDKDGVMRAFINNDGKAPLPPGWNCVLVDEKAVDAEQIVIGMTPEGEIPEPKLSLEDRLTALEAKVDAAVAIEVKV